MQVDILTPDSTLYSGEASVVTLPGSNGSFQLMENHAPLIANLIQGTVSIQHAGKTESFEVNGGMIEVVKNKVTILV